jgi:hypothetical protein
MRLAGGSAMVLLSTASVALAAKYPYSGFFAINVDRVSFDRAQLFCAYNFFIQNKDGTYVSYHLDLGGYLNDHSIKYLEYSRGQCVVDAEHPIETCTSGFDSDASVQGKPFIDVFKRIDATSIEATFFNDLTQAKAFVGNGIAGDYPPIEYDLCLDFDATSMAKYLSAERSTLSPDERLKLTAPQLDAATTAIMTRVSEAIRAGK